MDTKLTENRVTILLPKELKIRAKVTAIRRGHTLSYVVRGLLRMWLAGDVTLPAPETNEVDIEED